MYCVTIYKSGHCESVGKPMVFLDDMDLNFIIENQKARNELVKLVKSGACVGRLGGRMLSGYTEDTDHDNLDFEMGEEASFSCYANV